MKRFAVALAALAFAAPALAQDSGRGTVGLGVSIAPLETSGYTAPTVEVYVPIRIAPQLRLEPSFGLRTVDRTQNINEPSIVDERDLTVGLGVFFVQHLAAPVDFYGGGRLKLNFAKVSNLDGENTGTDVVIAAALGGEYYLASHFSLGLEAQLGYYSRSDASIDEADGFFTTGLAFLRMYF
jgi:hypothetical protein